MRRELREKQKHADWGTTELEQQPLVRTQSVVSRVVGGETLIVPVRGCVGDLASIYSFNGTGTLIWQMLETPKKLSELVAVVAERYEVERERAEQDVKDFVRELVVVGLVEVAMPAALRAEGPAERVGLEAADAR